ncbi:signal transduction histidine kinase [Paenibacillus castaneae]|uniref:sensor histidine kinase n=1 Tax=Paenibacillus castaneae TaxID=474957 RepID=UPI000C9BE084|nr:HAMP domain-containing sensor histidine kinase [Paenibacillus castaneae]NIK75912.1 signal transduction histidine kinase [Paenibacillus castaneae]
MLFVLIALWSIAAIVWLSDRRTAINRWLGAVAFSGGAGALAAVLDMQWLPAAANAGMNEVAQQLLYRLQAASSLLSYYGLPYAFLMFALAYRPVRMPRQLQHIMPFLLFIPILGCLMFTPYYTEVYPITFKVVVWWAAPYILYGTVQVLLKQQMHAAFSRTHWIVCSAVLPPVLFCMIMNYVLPSFGMLRMWIYNTWIVSFGVVIFFVGLFTYGFMGVRVMVDRRRFDSTLKAVTSGTAILNHAIKNDAGKIRLFSEKMKAYAIESDQQELLADVETVLQASRHLQDMLQRVHRRTEDLELRLEAANPALLIEQSLKPYIPVLGNIKLHTSLSEGWICRIDSAQVSEALGNIVANALEAMKGNGELHVRFTETKRELVIEVRDTGPGMDKRLAKKVLEPFYTTKSGSDTNFGLGLPYVYHVMRKHKGMLQLRSKLGGGTSVFMTFPKRNVKAEKTSAISPRGSEVHG